MAGDKSYDTRDFIAGCRELGITPHVVQNTTNRRRAIDGRTTRHAGHMTSPADPQATRHIEAVVGQAAEVDGEGQVALVSPSSAAADRPRALVTGDV